MKMFLLQQMAQFFFAGTNGGYGKMVKIKHKYGIVTTYGHLQKYLLEKAKKLLLEIKSVKWELQADQQGNIFTMKFGLIKNMLIHLSL